MIYPFVRMLQEKCRDLTEEQIHKTLWKEYEISGADRMFVERAKIWSHTKEKRKMKIVQWSIK